MVLGHEKYPLTITLSEGKPHDSLALTVVVAPRIVQEVYPFINGSTDDADTHLGIASFAHVVSSYAKHRYPDPRPPKDASRNAIDAFHSFHMVLSFRTTLSNLNPFLSGALDPVPEMRLPRIGLGLRRQVGCAGAGWPVGVPGSGLVSAVAGIGRQFIKDDCVHQVTVGAKQSDLIAVVVESETGLLVIEDEERARLKHRPGWNLIGRTAASCVVEEPVAEVSGGWARIVELDPLISVVGSAVAIPVYLLARRRQDLIEAYAE